MTEDQFRRLALSMPAAEERAHMGHPDFRVGGRIFATLVDRDDDVWGTLKLTPGQQREACASAPDVFIPVPGGWGRQGFTHVNLRAARVQALRPIMKLAWRNTAPKKLLRESDGEADDPI